jgi:uncharacterized protein YjdB
MLYCLRAPGRAGCGTRTPSRVRVAAASLLIGVAACDAGVAAPLYDDEPARIQLSASIVDLDRGDTSRVGVTVLNGRGSPLRSPSAGAPGSVASVVWSSSDPSVVTVSRSGLVLAQRAGEATVTAASGTLKTSARINVLPRGKLITVAPKVDTVAVSHSLQLSATVLNGAGREIAGPTITWSSSDPAIAIVDTRGLVKAVAVGTVLVVASAQGHSDTARVVVRQPGNGAPANPPVAAVAVTPGEATLLAGSSIRFQAAAHDGAGQPLAGRPIAWSSSDHAVATVDDAGLVTGRAPGAATIRATAEGVSGSAALVVTPASAAPPAPPAGGSGRSPHWSHIRTEITDFRTHYQPMSTRAAEYDWNARHFDVVMNGPLAEYRGRNPTIGIFPYTVLHAVRSDEPRGGLPSAYYADMEEWYQRNPQCRIEDAFLHQSQPRTLQTRIVTRGWGQNWWRTNLADPCFQSYTVDRFSRIMNRGGVHEANGVFLDAFDTGDLGLAWPNIEYPNRTAYFGIFAPALAQIRAALGPGKVLHVNIAEYDNDLTNEWAAVGGSALLEFFNNAVREMETRWDWVEKRLIGRGTRATLVPRFSKREYDQMPGYTSGGESSPGQRASLWSLTSYYLVRPSAERIDLLFFRPAIGAGAPFSEEWPRAAEHDIGHPREERRRYQERSITYALDGGQLVTRRATIWGREYDRALVLNSPRTTWEDVAFDDRTAVTMPLPAGESWFLLREDGTVGTSPVTAVTLRTGEGAILLKGSR